MLSQANAQAVKVLEVADDPRLSKETKVIIVFSDSSMPERSTLTVVCASECTDHR
jgi:hypothetical protein